MINKKVVFGAVFLIVTSLCSLAYGQTVKQLDDSVTKYIKLAHYDFRFDTCQAHWNAAMDNFLKYERQLHAKQDSLYAIEQRKVLNREYPEVKLK